MASTFPYISSAGPIVKTVERFRKQFPSEVTAETLKKLGIAPKNESYVINILRFLGVIDSDNRKSDSAKAFLQNDDSKFATEFETIVRAAYAPLFELFGENAWTQDRDALVTFFRTSDDSSDVVGKRQAITFMALAALSGHGEIQPQRVTTATPKKAPSAAPKRRPAHSPERQDALGNSVGTGSNRVGLSVRIEVNLPANGDQKTYDAIFQSIRKNLIDGE